MPPFRNRSIPCPAGKFQKWGMKIALEIHNKKSGAENRRSRRPADSARRKSGFRHFRPLTKYLASFFCKLFLCILAKTGYFAPAGATRGLSDRPLDSFGPPYLMKLLQARESIVSSLLCHYAGMKKHAFFSGGVARFRACGRDQGAFRSPPGPLRPIRIEFSVSKAEISFSIT